MRIARGLAIAVVSILVAGAPIAIAIGADALGGALGCEVHEGYASPCLIAGVDIGKTLSSAFVLGWLSVLLAPLAGIGVVVGLTVAFIDATRKR